MISFNIPDDLKQRPVFQLAPLIDIIFITLIFFVTLSIFYQVESEINISIPKAKEAEETMRAPGEIIINITKKGAVIINERTLDYEKLQGMLSKISQMYPNQAIIIRADSKTQHQHVIKVLDACSGAGIWNVAFAAEKEY